MVRVSNIDHPFLRGWNGRVIRYMITAVQRKSDLIKPIDNTILMPYNAPSIPGGLQ
jgi:fido (protein-threonine AMPylation protein)